MASARRSLFQPHRVTMGCEHRITYDGMGVRGIFFAPLALVLSWGQLSMEEGIMQVSDLT